MIEQIVYCAFFAFCCALLTALVDYSLGGLSTAMSEDRIFSRLGFWLVGKYEAFHKKETQRLNQYIQSLDDIEQVAGKRRVNPWKVFVCMICFNVWLGMITGCLLIVYGGLFTWWLWLPYIVLSNFFVRLLIPRLSS